MGGNTWFKVRGNAVLLATVTALLVYTGPAAAADSSFYVLLSPVYEFESFQIKYDERIFGYHAWFDADIKQSHMYGGRLEAGRYSDRSLTYGWVTYLQSKDSAKLWADMGEMEAEFEWRGESHTVQFAVTPKGLVSVSQWDLCIGVGHYDWNWGAVGAWNLSYYWRLRDVSFDGLNDREIIPETDDQAYLGYRFTPPSFFAIIPLGFRAGLGARAGPVLFQAVFAGEIGSSGFRYRGEDEDGVSLMGAVGPEIVGLFPLGRYVGLRVKIAALYYGREDSVTDDYDNEITFNSSGIWVPVEFGVFFFDDMEKMRLYQ